MRFPRGSFHRHEAVRRAIQLITPLLIALISLAAQPSTAGQADTSSDALRVHWKSLEMAQVRLDDKAPLKWNVYQPDKKDNKKDKKKDSDLVLVLLGHRYLMLDTKARLVYPVPTFYLSVRGTDFESGDLAQQARLVPSTDWTQR